MTDDINEKNDIEKLFQEYGKNKESNLHKSVMDIIVRANNEMFRRDKDMCDALLELMQDELEASKNQGAKDMLLELIGRKLAKNKTIEQIAEELEETPEAIQVLIEELA